VRFSVAARGDVERYAEFIGQDSPDAARRFLPAVRETAELLLRFPASGRGVILSRIEVPGVRRVSVRGFPNHILVYRVAVTSIDVLCVTHSARDLPQVIGKALRDPDADTF
jgi:plasmid stabilization system protein ParE